jgi:hypothetical protein
MVVLHVPSKSHYVFMADQRGKTNVHGRPIKQIRRLLKRDVTSDVLSQNPYSSTSQAQELQSARAARRNARAASGSTAKSPYFSSTCIACRHIDGRGGDCVEDYYYEKGVNEGQSSMHRQENDIAGASAL